MRTRPSGDTTGNVVWAYTASPSWLPLVEMACSSASGTWVPAGMTSWGAFADAVVTVGEATGALFWATANIEDKAITNRTRIPTSYLQNYSTRCDGILQV